MKTKPLFIVCVCMNEKIDALYDNCILCCCRYLQRGMD